MIYDRFYAIIYMDMCLLGPVRSIIDERLNLWDISGRMLQ